MSHERLQRGYTVVLTAISGDADSDNKIVQGLIDGKAPTAIDIHDWTRGPFLPFHNLRDSKYNRRRADEVAAKIVEYRRDYPGRPVYLMGYSAGAGMVVMSLEALPPDHQVTSAIVTAATLSPDYDLRLALSRTEEGIHSFYSYLDLPVLGGLSALAGTMDGRHTVAAGAVGFHAPDGLTPNEAEYYNAGLKQHHFSPDMLAMGHFGGHGGWASLAFARERLAPLITPQPRPDDLQWAAGENHDVRMRLAAASDPYGDAPDRQAEELDPPAASRSPVHGTWFPHDNATR